MKKGEKGARVLALQTALKNLNYLQPASTKADGTLDGICGPELINTTFQYAMERNFNLANDPQWTSEIPEVYVAQAQTMQPVYGRGVDVARYQPNVDWTKLQKGGISFAFIKATDFTQTGNGFVDSMFFKNWELATQAGCKKGAYMFWQPGDDPKVQADYFIRQTKKVYRPGDLRPVIDVEHNDKLTKAEVNRRLQVVIDTLKAEFGVPPIIYTSKRVCDEQRIEVGGECPVWLAFYVPAYDTDPGPKKDVQVTFRVGPPLPSQWKTWDIWQSGYGPRLPGCETTDIDRDLMRDPAATLPKITLS